MRPRPEIVAFRASTAEKQIIQGQADAVGKPVGAYLRDLALEDCRANARSRGRKLSKAKQG